MPALNGKSVQDLVKDWFTNNFTAGAASAHVKQKDNEPELWGAGNEVTVVTTGTLVTEDLHQYGYPYSSVTFTNPGANSVSILTSFAQGFCMFQLTGTTPDVDLTATNSNGDIIDDVFVVVLGSTAPVTGQNLTGAATTYWLAKP